ncbi:hypothetical protein NC651_015032 [Populus alba x Populus x berolinensis]|nr:hypothetical protein NC651_015032 [Populus alba x Populus x berolinensis]
MTWTNLNKPRSGNINFVIEEGTNGNRKKTKHEFSHELKLTIAGPSLITDFIENSGFSSTSEESKENTFHFLFYIAEREQIWPKRKRPLNSSFV